MELLKYNYLMIRLKKLSKDKNANFYEMNEIKNQLEKQLHYYKKVDIVKLNNDIKSGKFSVKELVQLREFANEANKHIKNEDRINSILVGDYEKNNARKLVYADRGLKALATAALIGLLGLGIHSCNKDVNNNTENTSISTEKDDNNTKTTTKNDDNATTRTNNNDSSKNNNNSEEKNPKVIIIDDEETKPTEDDKKSTDEAVEETNSTDKENVDETKPVENESEKESTDEESKSIEETKETTTEQKEIVDTNEETTKEEPSAIILTNNETPVNNETKLSEEEIDKLIEDAGKTIIVGTPEDVHSNQENNNNTTEETLPEVKDEDYGNEIVYEIPTTSEVKIESGLVDKEENIIIEESSDLELPDINNIDEYIPDEYYETEYDVTNSNSSYVVEEKKEEPKVEEKKEEPKEENSGLVEKEDKVIVIEATEGLPSLDKVEEDDNEKEYEVEKNILQEIEEIVASQVIDTTEIEEKIVFEENNFDLPTVVEEEDGSISYIDTKSLGLSK